jgi:hypothetical protein
VAISAVDTRFATWRLVGVSPRRQASRVISLEKYTHLLSGTDTSRSRHKRWPYLLASVETCSSINLCVKKWDENQTSSKLVVYCSKRQK